MNEAVVSADEVERLRKRIAALETELGRLQALLITPETEDFDIGVPFEAAHQTYRWGEKHDARKNAFDWYWLLGYLSQKAARAAVAGDDKKARHHIISSAAALRNWFLALARQSEEEKTSNKEIKAMEASAASPSAQAIYPFVNTGFPEPDGKLIADEDRDG